MFRPLKLFLSLILLGGVERATHKATGGFQLYKVAPSWPSHEEPSCLSLEQRARLAPIVSQPFTYLSHGGETYAFVSADGRTVLKLFKLHHMRPMPWLESLPLPPSWRRGCKRFNQQCIQKRRAFYESCTIAFDAFRQRTGLIFLHLQPTRGWQQRLTLYDKLGIAHQIDLDSSVFALQQRALPTYQHLRALRAEGNWEAAKTCIDSLVALLLERCQEGIVDRDPNIRRNCGFVDNRAIEMDIGSYSRQGTPTRAVELQKNIPRLRQWVELCCPELSSYMNQRIEQCVEN